MRGKIIAKSLPPPCQLFDVKRVSCVIRSPIKKIITRLKLLDG
jgi:hypothetical protein